LKLTTLATVLLIADQPGDICAGWQPETPSELRYESFVVEIEPNVCAVLVIPRHPCAIMTGRAEPREEVTEEEVPCNMICSCAYELDPVGCQRACGPAMPRSRALDEQIRKYKAILQRLYPEPPLNAGRVETMGRPQASSWAQISAPLRSKSAVKK
jgi:hypothetical protein